MLGVVRRHQGALKVVSTPGKGTTFTVWMPLADAPSTASHRVDAPNDVLRDVAEAMARRRARGQQAARVHGAVRGD